MAGYPVSLKHFVNISGIKQEVEEFHTFRYVDLFLDNIIIRCRWCEICHFLCWIIIIIYFCKKEKIINKNKTYFWIK